jgi:MFS family permease
MTLRAVAYFHRFRGFEPDARRFLVASLVGGAAMSLWWIDFNLYLASLGFAPAQIGLVATAGSLGGLLAAFPASSASDRFGRRVVLACSTVAMALALVGLLATTAPVAIVLLAALFSAGMNGVQVIGTPFLTEHSRPEHRSELFALQAAVMNFTNILAALLGGLVATVVAASLGLPAGGPGPYRIVLVLMLVLFAGGLVATLSLSDDRPALRRRGRILAAGEPARFPVRSRPGSVAARLGVVIHEPRAFARLLLPGFLISLGAGQVIPFLNVFIRGKFGLDLAALNAAFAVTSLGTIVAILAQPALARRFGRLASVVLVQGASIPFLLVLGFSPVLWTVVAAMAVRGALMNAGNPIFNAFAMDRVSPAERATLSASMTILWSLGWVIAAPWYSLLQATLGFEGGYRVGFVTIIVLYSIATTLYWRWFRNVEPRPIAAAAPA